MLKSCPYCGRIHDMNYECPEKPKKSKRRNGDIKGAEIDKFRNSKAWRVKRKKIKERDLYLCQVCIRKLYNTVNQYTYDGLQVHHAVSLEESWDKRLDDENLLTTCPYHHEMAESGEIPRQEILQIIKEQEEKRLK